MSSRLIGSGEPVEAAPIAWRQAGGPTVHTAPRGPATLPSEFDAEVQGRVRVAYQQGLTAGEAAAAERASARLEPVIGALNEIVQELAGVRKRFRMEAEQDTVKLAIAIARRVLHRELSTDPDAILGLVMAAFQKLNARETYRLRVAPAEAAVLAENRIRLELPPGVELVSDASLASGGAVFETSRGELDASIDTQLNEIQRGFTDLLRRRAS